MTGAEGRAAIHGCRIVICIVGVGGSSNLALDYGVIVNRETVVRLPFRIGKTKIPFVDWHVCGVQLAKASSRPRINYVTVHAWLNVATCLVVVPRDAIFLAPHVQPPRRVDR